MNGSSTIKDLETLLQLNYLYFTAPRRDAESYQTLISILNKEMLEKVSLDKALEVYKARFANPADFTFFFVGNVDPNDETFRMQVRT